MPPVPVLAPRLNPVPGHGTSSAFLLLEPQLCSQHSSQHSYSHMTPPPPRGKELFLDRKQESQHQQLPRKPAPVPPCKAGPDERPPHAAEL